MVVGEKRKFLTALVTIKTLVDSNGSPTDQLTQEVLDFLSENGSCYLFYRVLMNSLIVDHVRDFGRVNRLGHSAQSWQGPRAD